MIKHQVKGNASQMIVCQLDQGQTMFCEAGKFLWKTANVGVETRFTTHGQEDARKEKGFMGKALSVATEVGKRALAGESIAFQYFTPTGGSGLVAFAGTLPGEVREIQLSFNRRSTVEIRGLCAAIIAQPLAEIFDQRAGSLRGPGDVGECLWQGHGEVKGKLTE